MVSFKKCICLFLTLFLFLYLCGCWNYRLVEDLSIVSGVAIDRGSDKNYELTIEISEAKSGTERNVDSRIIQTSGDTIFDASRNGISLIGKKLYWSHTQAIIISEEIAKEELLSVIDWFSRDAETRTDVNIFVAKGMPAKEILLIENPTGNILSSTLELIIENETNLSKALQTQTWRVINDVVAPGISPQIPAVSIYPSATEEELLKVEGSALFQESTFVGFIDGEDTKNLLFVKDKVVGGILVFPLDYKGEEFYVSLEIFESKTKLKTKWDQAIPQIEVNIETVVALDEVQGSPGLIGDELIHVLEDAAGNYLKQRIEKTIRYIQTEYKCDSFGFGSYIYRTQPQKWSKLENVWDNIFQTIKVTVSPKIIVKNSATQENTISKGDKK